MKRYVVVPRPTERLALRPCERSPKPIPSTPALFAGLVTAHALGDRCGQYLFAHAIARQGGEVGE